MPTSIRAGRALFSGSPWLACGFAALLCVLGAFAQAQGQIAIFGEASGTVSGGISFGTGGEGATLQAGCGGCVTVTAPSNIAGSYNLSINGFGILPTQLLPNPTGACCGSLSPGIYSESFGGDIQISISNPGGVLISGSCALTIFGDIGSTNAVIQCTLTPPEIGTTLLPQPTAPVYLIFAGTTSGTVGSTSQCVPQTSTGPGCPAGSDEVEITSFNPVTLDWYGTLASAPYASQNFVSVPNVSVANETEGAAETTITTANLTVGTTTTATSTAVALGDIISQSPAAGASVPEGWPVSLVVSAGPPLVAVPNVVGDLEAAAIAALQGQGLTVTTVTAVTSSAGQTGNVTIQNPAAGALVDPGSAVALTVGAGTPTPPPLITYTGDGTSSFQYNLYVDSTTFVEATILGHQYNTSSVGAFYNGPTATDSNGNIVVFEVNYTDTTTPIVCGAGGCMQNLNGSGNLTILTCPPGTTTILQLAQCTTQQAALGGTANHNAGYDDYVVAGTTLSELMGGSVNQAAFSISYTPTQSYSPVTGITTHTPDAQTGYFIVTGSSATLPSDSAFNTQPSPAAMSLCSIPTGFPPLCGTYTAGQAGPFYSPFYIDWTASVSPTPYVATSPPVTVPSVVNDTQAAASTAITGAGLVVGTVTTASSSTVPSGSVISQNPTAGTSVAAGSAVNLVVSTGPAPVLVPNVVNDTQAAATTAITGKGLVVGTVTTASSSTVPSGSVISQSPTAGTSVAAGSAVNLVVSSGAASVSVPNVLNDTQAVATTAITGVGLTVGVVTSAASPLAATGELAVVPAGEVASQSPAGGTSVAAGTAVSFVVSTGPLRGDINLDGQVDKRDLALITAVLNTPASGPNDPRDLNHDGVINVLDARILVTLCTYAACAIN
jgi:beta-lactam-binding protein with PASTA domain